MFPRYHVLNPLHHLFMEIPKRPKVITTDNSQTYTKYNCQVLMCYEEDQDIDTYIENRFKYYKTRSFNAQSS